MASSSSSEERPSGPYEMTAKKGASAASQELPIEFEDIVAPPHGDERGPVEFDEGEAARRETMSTVQDVRSMQRMGHKQQFVRHFRLISTISFVAIATADWELAVFLMNYGLYDGGRAGLIWGYVWNFFGFLPIILSMAEMSSMAPIAGAQYHWVSEFAPRKYQKILSYFTGWFSTLAWQAGNAQGLFLCGTLIQTLILLNNESYAFPNYQGTLLVIASAFFVLALNYYFTPWLPYTQNLVLVLHTLLYFALLIPVWVNAPKTTATVVFTEFDNLGGWPSLKMAVLAGQLSGISAMTGVDTAAHMSEEIKDASRNVPIAMMGAYFLNMAFSLPIIITLCFAMPDLNAALNDPTYYPVIYVMRQTMTIGWASALIALIIFVLFFSNVAYLAAASRDLFAFARDSGVPFGPWVSKVDRTRRIPFNALLLSVILASLLSLIYLGSPTAFYALTSLFVVSILQCYMFSIGSILYRRLYHPSTLPPAVWSLGRWGVPVNATALIYVIYAFFWSFWPEFYNPGAAGMNWAIVLFGATLVGSGIWYVARARFVYRGPVVGVEGRRDS